MPEMPRRGYFRIDLANNCNIRCIMCQAYNSLPVNAMKFLDFDLFKSQTRGELGKWQSIQLGNVAEATIHPRFVDYLRYIRSEAPDSTIHIVTNGKTLQKFAGLINEVGNCLVQISMDSIRKETHEYIRAGSNYDRAVENIELLDIKRTRVLLSFTLMRSNIEEYPAMVAFCRERGYHMSAFPMIVRSENGILPFNLLQESLWFSRNQLSAWLKEYYGAEYQIMIGTASGAMQAVTEFSCNAHYDDLNLDALGTVNLCGKLNLGNLQTEPLRTLWNGPQAEGFRLQVETDRGPCMTCDYRQRCLSPSMALIDNHFSEEIAGLFSPEARHALRYEREISDDEALWRLVRDLGHNVGVFEIAENGRHWSARKISAASDPGRYEYGESLHAESRHDLHSVMLQEADTGANVEFLEPYGIYNLVKYRHKYWALPGFLGHLNLTHDGDRNKPGILVSNSVDELKKLCVGPEPPRLLGSTNGYNLVAYGEKFWAIPLSYGPFDLTDAANRSREGVLLAGTMTELQQRCHGLLTVLS